MRTGLIVVALMALPASAQVFHDSVAIVGYEGTTLKSWDLWTVRGFTPSMAMLMAIDTVDNGGTVGTLQLPFQAIRTVRFIADQGDTCTPASVNRPLRARHGAASGSGAQIRVYNLAGRPVAVLAHGAGRRDLDACGLSKGVYLAGAAGSRSAVAGRIMVAK